MRAMFMVVASIILAAGLFGCNRQQQVAEQAPVTAVAPPPAAVPPPPPVPAAEPAYHSRHHTSRRTHYASYESEDQSGAYSQSEDYSEGDQYSGDDYDVSTDEQSSGAAAEAHGEVWVDGYGREHYTAAATPGDDPGALSREDERLRRKVWRGWNSDCDERGN